MGFQRVGSEFLVNTITTGTQQVSGMTALSDGRFVITWTDFNGDGSGAGVRAQIFNPDGTRWGGEFLVNTTTTSVQEQGAPVALADGGFMVFWSDASGTAGDNSGYAIRGQRFSSSGAKVDSEVLVNVTTFNNQITPSAAVLDDGRIVVAWNDLSELGGDISGYSIRGRILNADGTPFAGEFIVNSRTIGDQRLPTIAGLDGGRFVIVWTDMTDAPDDPIWAIRGQLYEADGSRSGVEFLINSTTIDYQANGTVTKLADGGFVVTWSDFSASPTDTSGYAVRGRAFDADGTARGADFAVNATTFSDQFNAGVTALADGRFVVVYVDSSATGLDNSLQAVRAQVFSAEGLKSGQEFIVNTTISQAQTGPNIVALPDGRFVVSWTDYSLTGGDNSNSSVKAQVFDPSRYDGDMAGEAVIGGGFSDSMFGMGGDDVLSGRDGGDYLNGGDGSDNLNGDGGDDRLIGGASADVLFGGAGNDILDGGLNGDQMAGGLGDDVYYFDNGLDFVIENAGEGTDRVYFSVNGALAANFENGDLTGVAALTLNGNALSNVLRGNVGNNVITGGGGADQMIGGLGDDIYYVDSTSDTVVELTGQGTDLVYTTNNFDASAQAIENITLTGTLARNLTGNALNNILTGNSGNNVLNGGSGGADALIGGMGNDVYHINSTSDVITELAGEGTDTVFTSVTYTLEGKNLENGTLTGTGNINLIGSTVANVLIGNSGVNTLVGAGGADTLTGGAGADKFDFNAVGETAWATYDTITDLESTDVIDLASIDANSTASGNQAFVLVGAFSGQAGQLRLVYSSGSGDTWVQGDVDGDGVGDFRIRLTGDHRDYDNFAL